MHQMVDDAFEYILQSQGAKDLAGYATRDLGKFYQPGTQTTQ